AVRNADEANTQRAAAEQANQQLAQTNDALTIQQQATQNQRVAAVARQLAIGSQGALAQGDTDRALVLAAQSASFAARSGGLVGPRGCTGAARRRARAESAARRMAARPRRRNRGSDGVARRPPHRRPLRIRPG